MHVADYPALSVHRGYHSLFQSVLSVVVFFYLFICFYADADADADSDAVTPSSINIKHQELHTSEGTIVPRTVIFLFTTQTNNFQMTPWFKK